MAQSMHRRPAPTTAGRARRWLDAMAVRQPANDHGV